MQILLDFIETPQGLQTLQVDSQNPIPDSEQLLGDRNAKPGAYIQDDGFDWFFP